MSDGVVIVLFLLWAIGGPVFIAVALLALLMRAIYNRLRKRKSAEQARL